MSASELKKQVNEMREAYDLVVKAATEPIQKDINEKFSNLLSSVDSTIESKVTCLSDDLIDGFEQSNESIGEMRRSVEDLCKKLNTKNEGSAMLLLESLSAAFDKFRWEENN